MMTKWKQLNGDSGDSSESFHLRTVQVCGEHNDGVGQHIGSVCTGKQSLTVEEDT